MIRMNINCKSIIYGIILLITSIIIKFINDGTLVGRCDDRRKYRSKNFGIIMESNFHFLWSLSFTGLLVLLPYENF